MGDRRWRSWNSRSSSRVFGPSVASGQESVVVKQRFDVIVVGVGSMGAATCCYLARRGVRVLGLEQFGIPHALGAHHGHTRMIRMAYFEHPDYVPLVKRAYELWGELEEQSGEKLLYLTGGLYMGDQQSQLINGAVAASEQHGLRYQVLDHAELQQKFPQFRLPSSHQGFFEDRAGVLLPEKVVATFAEQAMRHGAELHGHEPVEDWSSDGQGVTVRTKLNTYQADCVVFTGGAWSEKLLVDCGVHLSVTRQVLAWFWPRRTESFALGTFPAWYLDTAQRVRPLRFPVVVGAAGLQNRFAQAGYRHRPRSCRSRRAARGDRRAAVDPSGTHSRCRWSAGLGRRLSLFQQPGLPFYHRSTPAKRSCLVGLRIQRPRVQVFERGR